MLRVSRIERHDGGSDLEGHVISVDAVDLSTTQDLKSNDLTASEFGLRIIAIVAVVFCVLGAVILALYKEKKVMGIIEEAHKKENLPE